ncbi:MAG: FtsX-like permease family protein [Deltaproteobacteria bacterium]|nr:FtsX-like permease family protein [Deltaproteobacteria bacterium]
MSVLARKLWRDLGRLRWQVLSIAFVVAAGVAILVSAVGTFRSLERARAGFYATAHFPQVFVRLTRAPDAVATQLARIDGVQGVETRLAFSVRLDLPEARAPVAALALSLPRPGDGARSRLLLEWGRLPRPEAPREVVVNEAFALARGMRPGERLPVILNGQRETLTVVGAVLSAEHVAVMRPGEHIPDDEHYGVIWLDAGTLAAAYRAEGTFNEAQLWLAPGAREDAVIGAVDRVLGPHGGYGANGRSEQPAHKFVDGELQELEVEATVLPVIFLGVAAFLLNMVLARIVAQERTQVATLRALGFGVGTVVRHYLLLATVISGAGWVAGVGLGVLLGGGMTAMYRAFFRFPEFEFRAEPSVLVLSLAISLGAGLMGALASALRLARLAPAEALQPAPPHAFRRGWLERLGLMARLPMTARLALRNVAGRPLRAASSTVGVAAAMGILVVGAFWQDAFEALVVHQFQRVQREDGSVVFMDPVPDRAVRSLEHVPGIRRAEGVRVVPVRMRAGRLHKRVALMGLPGSAGLRRLVGKDGSELTLPDHGLVMSSHLADGLGVGPGARVTLEVLEGKRPRRALVVAAVVEERLGMSAYMDRDALCALLGEAPSASLALVALDPLASDGLQGRLARFPAVVTFSVKQAMLSRFQDTMMEIVLVFSLVLTLLAALVVAGIVYNAARIQVSERERELATMRVMGFSRGDISEVLILELALQVLPALVLGALVGQGLCTAAVQLFGPEDLSLPVVIAGRTWALAVGVVLASATVTALAVRRRLDRLDLVAVLKVRE